MDTISISNLSTPPARVQVLIRALMASGVRPEQIAVEMENRVSSRTIYRWLKGEHTAQQKSDMESLEKVATKYLGDKLH